MNIIEWTLRSFLDYTEKVHLGSQKLLDTNPTVYYLFCTPAFLILGYLIYDWIKNRNKEEINGH